MERTARPVRKCGSGNTTLRFDPYMGAAVLRKLSELACREPSSRLMDPTEPVFVAAAAVLADAKGWLEHYRTPFDHFAGDLLLAASDNQLLLFGADTFASTLTSAALELLTVARLVELREKRIARSGLLRADTANPSDEIVVRTRKG